MLPFTLGVLELDVQRGVHDRQVAEPLREFDRKLEQLGQRDLSSEQRRAMNELTAASDRLRRAPRKKMLLAHRDWQRATERFEVAVCGE